MSRNQIPSKCDEIIEMLLGKIMMPQGKSGLSFFESILFRIEYYSNLSSEKRDKKGKNKGGKWVDHLSIPCFTPRVRTDDLKAMDNYTVKKPSYIYNIKNKDDDLCFIRYLIVTKFLSLEEHTPYLLYRNEKERYKNYYVSKRSPQIDPHTIDRIDAFLPFINYPNKEIT